MLDILWGFVVLGSVAGWGLLVRRAMRRWAGVDLDRTSEVLGIGIAAVVAVIGLLLAVDRGEALPAVVLVGIGGVIAEAVSVFQGTYRPSPQDRRAVVVGGVVLLGFLLVSAALSINANWMVYDDLNYLYLAKRITDAGDLVDPGNLRRIQTLGGLSGLQAMLLLEQPTRFLRLADLWLGGTLLLTSLWRRSDRQWSVLGIGVAALVLLVYPTMIGLNFNSSPNILPVGIMLILFRFVVRLRCEEHDGRGDAGLALLVAVMLATQIAIRPFFGIPLVPVAAIVVLWPPWSRRTLIRIVAAFAGAMAVLSGWMVASWRAVGTPMYPLMPGNTDPTFPTLGNRLVPFEMSALGGRVIGAFLDPPWIVVSAVGLTVLFAASRARAHVQTTHLRRESVRFLVVTFLVMLLWMVVFTVTFWNFGEPSGPLLTRYYSALLLGLGLVPLVVLQDLPKLADQKSDSWQRGIVGGMLVVVLLGGSFGAIEVMIDAGNTIVSGRIVDSESNELLRARKPEYDEVVRLLPPNAKVFTAVDNPHLLLGGRQTIHTLDVPGFASERPHLRYFAGDEVKLEWLRQHGYEYLVAMLPGRSIGPYSAATARESADDPALLAFSIPWSPYVIDWSEFVGRLAERSPAGATIVGDLVVVPLT